MSKRKWWLVKPRGNCPPSRKWQHFRYGRDDTITEIGIFNDDWPVARLTRHMFVEPIHCEDSHDERT